MGAFSSQKTLYGDTARIPQVAEKIRQAFVNEGYEVRIEDPASGQRRFVSAAVVIAQIWGMVQQSKLDEKALAIAERELYKH